MTISDEERVLARSAKALSPIFVGAPIYRLSAFPPNHPLAIRRAAAVEDMCRILGWLETGYVESPRATREQLMRRHDPDYVAAVELCSREGKASAEDRARFQLGTAANPIFPGLFERASTAVGGSIRAAELASEGRVVFHPAGGTHHGGRAHASGFCYFNDPVFAILELIDRGARHVAYVDFDAHHGDGVEDALAEDDRVFTISVHEANRWPRTGALHDRRAGRARNLPVPRGLNDSEFNHLVDAAVAPLVARFRPDAIVVVCGADALKGDPLAKLALSNRALQRAVEGVASLAPAVVVLGGGGYNPWTLVRCWSGLWGRLAGYQPPVPLPLAARELLASLSCDLVDEEDRDPRWLTSLDDAGEEGPVRDEIRAIAAATMA